MNARSRHARRGRIDPVSVVLALIPLIAIPVLGWQGWQMLEERRAADKAEADRLAAEKAAEEAFDPNYVVPEWGSGGKPKASMFSAAATPGGNGQFIELADSTGRPSKNPHASAAAMMAGDQSAAAVRTVGESLNASLGLDRKVLVVWLMDSSRSSDALRADVTGQLKAMYASLKKPSGANADADHPPVLSLAAKFTSQLEWLTAEPTADTQQLVSALTNVRGDDDAHENTFTAVNDVIDKVLEYRTKQGRFVTIVLVTDEVGDDEAKLDELLPKAKRYLIPINVIGLSASFGSAEGSNQGTERGSDADPRLVRQGPESREIEWIQLAYPGSEPQPFATRLGPYSLERLCVETGGTYFALPQPYRRPQVAGNTVASDDDGEQISHRDRYYLAHGPNAAAAPGVPKFEVETAVATPIETASTTRPAAKVYRPAYLSEAQYRADVAGNKAKQALIAAGHLAKTEIVTQPEMTFLVGDNDAALTGALQNAQKPVARLKPGVDRLYDTLKQGEADAAKLTDPRWQAGYYLAMGRAMAAKARADGYIELCGKLTNGAKFQNDSSTTWFLERTNEPTGVSVVDRMATKAREYLNKVVTQHPDTPWALAAQAELQVPLGWKWTER